MKKMAIIIFICLLYVITGCGNQYERDSSSGELIEISLSQMQEKLNNGDEFVVAFTHALCKDCQSFKAIFQTYKLNHHVVIYDIELSKEKLSETENKAIIQTFFPTFDTTPGIYYTRNGHVVSSLTDTQTKLNEEILDTWVQKNKLDEKE